MKYLKTTNTLMLCLICITLVAQDNIFNGNTDSDWDNPSNWSTGKVPPSHIVQKITIMANCVVPASNTTDYTFANGSSFQINSGISFTNNGTGTWTMNGTFELEGTYIGNLIIHGNIEPGSNTATWTCGDPIIYDGQSYPTVQIGGQCWIAENLNIGTMINGNTNQTDNNILEKYCYDNNTANCNTYGGLYQWDEMMQYTTLESAQGVCPTGWHLPSQGEWITLTDALGGAAFNAGSRMAGNAALWLSGGLVGDPQFGTSGLTVIPGGSGSYGFFQFQSEAANLWTSTESYSGFSNRLILHYTLNSVGLGSSEKAYGFSVRCIKD